MLQALAALAILALVAAYVTWKIAVFLAVVIALAIRATFELTLAVVKATAALIGHRRRPPA